MKSYLDYGAYTPIQVAAAAALNGPTTASARCLDLPNAPRDALIESFGKAGWTFRPPRPRCSPGCLSPKFPPSRQPGVLEALIERPRSPVRRAWASGEHGDDYVRLAIVENEQRIRQAARNIARFMKTADTTLHNVIDLKKRA